MARCSAKRSISARQQNKTSCNAVSIVISAHVGTSKIWGKDMAKIQQRNDDRSSKTISELNTVPPFAIAYHSVIIKLVQVCYVYMY